MKGNMKLVIGIIIGVIISSGVVAATMINSSDVSYKDTNVESALNGLYDKASNYKKLNTITTAVATDILTGKTAYDNNGNLITGNNENNCISGSFTCDSKCTGSTGKKVLNFRPTKFIMHLKQRGDIIYYDPEVAGTSVWDLYPSPNPSSWVEYPSPNYSSYFVFANNSLTVRNWGSSVQDDVVDYVACK